MSIHEGTHNGSTVNVWVHLPAAPERDSWHAAKGSPINSQMLDQRRQSLTEGPLHRLGPRKAASL